MIFLLHAHGNHSIDTESKIPDTKMMQKSSLQD